jgi:hypothetical protein
MEYKIVSPSLFTCVECLKKKNGVEQKVKLCNLYDIERLRDREEE